MIVNVLINTSVKTLNKVYDYLVPKELEDLIQIGKRVSVSFGNTKKTDEGIIVKIINEEEYNDKGYKLKSIIDVLDDISYIDEQKLKLAKYMSHIYFCNVYDCLKLMLPPGTTSKNSSKKINVKQDTRLILNYSSEQINDFIEEGKITSAKHIKLLTFLMTNDYVLLSDVVQGLSISKAIVNTVQKNGYIRFEKVEIKDDFLAELETKKIPPKILNEEQTRVADGIGKYINSGIYKQCLLFGITGSGKTEVYLDLIERTIKNNKKAIMLIPEISLTHQTVSRFVQRFGNDIAVLNSKMTIQKRKEEYKRIKEGKVNIVIGARSALFCPIDNLGLVIIDEAHDSSYYSSTTPKYSTKEVAAFLCNMSNSVLVLGTATPEVGDYYKTTTENSAIERFELKNRPGNAVLPEIITVDMKEEKVLGNSGTFSLKLKELIKENIEQKKQTMIFLNRRGYTSYLSCKECSYIFKCPNCDVALVYHKQSNLLLCHYCSHVEKNVTVCPNCGSENIQASTLGTQKIEEELNLIYPEISVLRMDADTTVAKDSHQKILDKFKKENVDVLVGTQMIAKGHDISNVTLVGILGVDSLLNMNDYLSSEKAFQNIYQVAGRAGRGDYKGKVVIQTTDTDNFVLEAIRNNSYEEFYEKEISFRKNFEYPPFVDLVLFELSSKDLNRLKMEADTFYKILKNNNSNLYKVFSPKSPFVQKINNKFRINILIKTKLNKSSYNEIYKKIREYEKIKKKDINFVISKNPNNF